ncbi:DUF4386 family protein [Haladaptatus sp. DYSN1]|uniref:DUF4386 family protein n=1 Tax=unclassified Haladaptatus TaxID=2622732 RepID=UPI002405586D|nr:DUF4386 family protein [Haladaptatus sp. DYSN1]
MATEVSEISPATEGEPIRYSLQRAGGIAALVDAATFVVGFALFFTLIAASNYGSLTDPSASVEFLVANQLTMYVWNLTIYIVFGIALVVLALALYARLRDGAPALSQVATAFGLIWAGLVIASGMVANVGIGAVVELAGQNAAQAETTWLALQAVENGLGGGNEIAGGVWVLLVSLAALRAGELSRGLNYLGALIGVSGLLTVVPGLEVLGAVFGLGLIVWFVWVGVVMLRAQEPTLRVRPTGM